LKGKELKNNLHLSVSGGTQIYAVEFDQGEIFSVAPREEKLQECYVTRFRPFMFLSYHRPHMNQLWVHATWQHCVKSSLFPPKCEHLKKIILDKLVSEKFSSWVTGLQFLKTQYSCINKKVSRVPGVSLLSVGALLVNCS